jgi:hypothetical protein
MLQNAIAAGVDDPENSIIISTRKQIVFIPVPAQFDKVGLLL